MNTFSEEIIQSLRMGEIGIIPTDTIYGVVGSALSPEVVERIYRVRGRDADKPMSILIAAIEEVARFGIVLHDEDRELLARYWPGKISIVFPIAPGISGVTAALQNYQYLHRGTGTLCFRVPGDDALRQVLREIGPLVAPSANPPEQPPALNIDEARNYFGDRVDFYLDAGHLESAPSTVAWLTADGLIVKRQGAVTVSEEMDLK